MSFWFYALGALKVWMLIDAFQRRASPFWYFIIALVPMGSVAYFLIVKGPEFGIRLPGTGIRPVNLKRRPADLEQMRYEFQSNPCLANQAMLAAALFDAGEYDEAQQHYRGVLKRDAGYQRALYGLGLCHMRRDNPAAAVEQLRTLLDQERSYADYQAWLDLAASLAASGEPDKSIESLEGLLAACPRMNHCVVLAEALIEAERADEARTHLERALLDHDHAPKHVKKQFSASARQARQMLGQIG